MSCAVSFGHITYTPNGGGANESSVLIGEHNRWHEGREPGYLETLGRRPPSSCWLQCADAIGD
jgi:hypothetical protein